MGQIHISIRPLIHPQQQAFEKREEERYLYRKADNHVLGPLPNVTTIPWLLYFEGCHELEETYRVTLKLENGKMKFKVSMLQPQSSQGLRPMLILISVKSGHQHLTGEGAG